MSEHSREEHPPSRTGDSDDGGSSGNELDYRNVDEEAEHDERGSQGPGPTEQPPREQ
jgi:hypothetical protein